MVRDAKGKFIKGVTGNPKGRPKKSKEDRYYEILITTVTKDDWQDIIKRAVYDAKRGDASARTWLSNYLIGPAKQVIDINASGCMVIKWEDNGGDND